MNAVSAPTQLSTIPTSTPEASPEPVTAPAAPPAGAQEPSGAASVAEAPDPTLEVARRLDKIARAEAKTRRAESEHHERMAKLAEREKEIAAKLEELDGALGDPVKYMLDKGKDPVEVAKRFSKPETEEEKRIRKLEEQLTERSERERKAEEAAKEQAAKAEEHTIVRRFVSEITEENSPNLVAMYAAHEVPGLVRELLNRRLPSGETELQSFQHTHGRDPSNAEIRKSLEAEAQLRATKILKSLGPKDQTSASQAPETAPKQSGPAGISNKHASASTSGAARKPSREERRAQAMRELAERLEAEAATRTE